LINFVVVQGGGEHKLKNSSRTPNNFHQLNHVEQGVYRKLFVCLHNVINLAEYHFSQRKDRIQRGHFLVV
jgi:hypothetical protein